MATLIRFLLTLIVWLPLVALNAWGIQIIWNWYIPLIFSLPNLEFNAAIGISLLSSYLTHQYQVNAIKKTEKEEWSEWLTSFFLSIIKPLVAVGLAWVYLRIWPLGDT